MFKRIFSTKINAAANFAGAFSTALLALIFVPFYLRYIGIESYGLIGIFNGLIAFIVLLDFGLSPALNRELARLSAIEGKEQEMHDLKSTLERLNWGIAIGIAVLFIGLTPLIAGYWVQPRQLSVSEVSAALAIMSVNIAIQFSINFYTGGLMGLRKQVVLNLIVIVCNALRFIGAFLVLAFYSPTILAFVVWQGAVLLLQAILMAVTLAFSLPTAERPGRFRKDLLRKVGRFAAGITGITVVTLILTQTDKVILSRMVNLETFGYYTLAVTMSTMAVSVVINSISHAVYPQFSRFIAAGDEAGLTRFYHHCCQLASVLLFPITAIMCLFSREILFVWTGNEQITNNTYLFLSIVALGTGLNGLMWLPYFLQLAYGWTRLTFYTNLVAILILVPTMIWGVLNYGAIGGAVAWLALNVGYVIVSPHLIHRRILRGEQWAWYSRDVALPLLGALSLGLAGKLALPSLTNRIELGIGISLISIAALVAATLLSDAGRGYLSLKRKATVAS